MENKDVLDWLNAAEIDVRSAKVLLREGLYSAAVFHTQQAYEKTYKAYWTLAKDEPELKKFGHLGMNKKMFDKMRKEPDEENQLLNRFGVHSFEDYKKAVKALVLADRSIYASFLPFFTALIKNDEIMEKPISDLKNVSETIAGKHGMKGGFGSLLITFTGIGMVAPLISAHFEFVRYPNKEIKPTDYKREMGIVQVLPELLSLVEYGMNKLREFI